MPIWQARAVSLHMSTNGDAIAVLPGVAERFFRFLWDQARYFDHGHVGRAGVHRIRERTKAALRRARRAERKLGRKAVEVDMGKVNRLRAETFGLRVVAQQLGVSVNTLQKARRKGWVA